MTHLTQMLRNPRRSVLLCVLVLAALFPSLTFASPVIRSGETVSVEADQSVPGDFYGFGSAVTVSGEVNGDAHIAGGTVTVNAPIAEDLSIAGGSIQVHGSVADDLRVMGGEVTLASDVGGDVVVLGGVLRVLSTATVAGDVIVAAGDVQIDGPVEGSIFGFAETVRVDAYVGGDVTLRADRSLTLGDQAEIAGDITYTSASELTRAQGSVVVGDTVMNPRGESSDRSDLVLVPLIMLLFAALVLMLVARRPIGSLAENVRRSYGINGLIGLGVFMATPFLVGVLLLSILGFWVGLILLFGYLALLLFSLVVTGMLLGAFVMKYFTNSASITFVSVMVGILLLELIALVPFIGPLLVFAGTLIALGTIVRRAYDALLKG